MVKLIIYFTVLFVCTLSLQFIYDCMQPGFELNGNAYLVRKLTQWGLISGVGSIIIYLRFRKAGEKL